MSSLGLVDQFGRPFVDDDELTHEIAGPTMAGIRSAWHESAANGLTPGRLAGLLRMVDQGDALDYLTLAEEMEERDLHYYSELSKRKLAVSSLPLFVEAVDNSSEAEKQADFAREILTSDEAGEIIPQALDALGKGFSVQEIIWDRSAAEYWPCKFKWVDPRFFKFDWKTGQSIRLQDEANPLDGLPLSNYKFVYHRPQLKSGMVLRGGLARLAAIAFMAKGYTLKDWLAFAEVFGMPLRVGKYGAGARPEDKAALLRAVTNIGSDAAAIIPESMIIEFVASGTSSGGDKLFLNLAEYLDKQVSKGVVGQTASSEGVPGSLGGQDDQANVRKDIWTSDAKQLSMTLRRDVVKAAIDLNFGPQPRGRYPKVFLRQEEAEDLASFSTAIGPLIDRGLPVEVSVVLDKFGLEMPKSVTDKGMLLTPISKGEAPGAPNPGLPGAPQPEPLDTNPETDEDLPEPEDGQSMEDYLQSLTRTQLLALASQAGPDEADPLVEEQLTNWRTFTDPLLLAVVSLAHNCEDKAAFLKGLKKLKVKRDSPAATLAIATFKARIDSEMTGG